MVFQWLHIAVPRRQLGAYADLQDACGGHVLHLHTHASPTYPARACAPPVLVSLTPPYLMRVIQARMRKIMAYRGQPKCPGLGGVQETLRVTVVRMEQTGHDRERVSCVAEVVERRGLERPRSHRVGNKAFDGLDADHGPNHEASQDLELRGKQAGRDGSSVVGRSFNHGRGGGAGVESVLTSVHKLPSSKSVSCSKSLSLRSALFVCGDLDSRLTATASS